MDRCVSEQDRHTLLTVHPSKQKVSLHIHHREKLELQKKVKRKKTLLL